jgi:ribosome biogenesis GTPase
MSSLRFSVHQLGWRMAHAEQLTAEDFDCHFPARIARVDRSGLSDLSERGEILIDSPAGEHVAVGDWVLLDAMSQRFVRLLERETLLSRMAAGIETRTQVVAANVDTIFVVTSCDHDGGDDGQEPPRGISSGHECRERRTRPRGISVGHRSDFNLSRLERYLALARQARVEPVVVLTKADLADRAGSLVEQVAQIAPGVSILAMDARDPAHVAALMPWLRPAMTAVFVGSSGVGKSTLANTLTGARLATSAVREADGKGRHTTTARHMLAVPNGGWIIDTPGMRELKLGDVEEGVRSTFEDIERIAVGCRFRDCTHQGDAGCAVLAATSNGNLSSRRLDNYLKLQREAKHARQSIRERREAERKFGRMCKAVIERRKREQGG